MNTPGKLFGFDLLDCSGEEIHVSTFNSFVDSFYSQIEIGTVYTVSNGTIKTTNPAYNHLNNHIEIVLSSTSTIQPCLHAIPSIPVHSFHFKTIDDLQATPLNSMVDLIGMVISISPASTIRKKDGSETSRRTVALRDTSCFSIDVTLWGHHCHNKGSQLASLYSSDPPPVLAIKGARLTDFNCRTLVIVANTTRHINPDIEPTHILQKWFTESSFRAASPSLSRKFMHSVSRTNPKKTILELQTMKPYEKALWFYPHASIVAINMDDFHFLACPLFFDGLQCMQNISH